MTCISEKSNDDREAQVKFPGKGKHLEVWAPDHGPVSEVRIKPEPSFAGEANRVQRDKVLQGLRPLACECNLNKGRTPACHGYWTNSEVCLHFSQVAAAQCP